jgi:hypothetical protein
MGLREQDKYTPRYLYSFVSSIYVSSSTHLLDLSIHFPTSLFSVMMKDLNDMLSEHNIGVPIAS